MGNLTRDVEVKYTANNNAVANIGLAVNRRYRSGDEYKEETTFIDCEAWGKTAETMGKYLSKGRPVFIEGRLKLDEWQDRDGNRRTKLVTVVENFQFIDSRSGGSDGGGGGNAGASAQTAPSAPNVSSDDIPF
jgi:single-strand DNA-binding protein